MKKLFILFLLLNTQAFALPFNDDMVENQLSTGQVMRPNPEGSIPLGSLKYKLDTKEEAEALTNPVAADEYSIQRGKRLFKVNCSACHGEISTTEHKPSVAGKFMGAPNIADALYTSRTDGNIYKTIHFGNIIMPAVGWKLSPQETWDIINYVRSAQRGGKE